MLNVIREMMYHAANEIGWQPCDENVEQLLLNLYHGYDIVINDETISTTQLMQTILNEIELWKIETKRNFM